MILLKLFPFFPWLSFSMPSRKLVFQFEDQYNRKFGDAMCYLTSPVLVKADVSREQKYWYLYNPYLFNYVTIIQYLYFCFNFIMYLFYHRWFILIFDIFLKTWPFPMLSNITHIYYWYQIWNLSYLILK